MVLIFYASGECHIYSCVLFVVFLSLESAEHTSSTPHVSHCRYSAIEGNTWLRPHWGASNRKLKLHLGLRVPQQHGRHCAEMLLGNGALVRDLDAAHVLTMC